MNENAAVLLTLAANIGVDEDFNSYPVHVRSDEESYFVDIHVGDNLYALEIPKLALRDLDNANLIDPAQYGAPKRRNGELLN